jgi:hypothetical protein
MRLNADPMDVEAQREIENAIAMENINANMEQAMEYNPGNETRISGLCKTTLSVPNFLTLDACPQSLSRAL